MGIFDNKNGMNSSDIKRKFKGSVFLLKKNGIDNVKYVLGKGIKLQNDEEIEVSYEDLYLCLKNKGIKKFFEEEKILVVDVNLSEDSDLDYDSIDLKMLQVALGVNHLSVFSDKMDKFNELLKEKDSDLFVKKVKNLSKSQLDDFVKFAIEKYCNNEFDSAFKISVLEESIGQESVFEDSLKARNFVPNNNMWN